MAIDVEAPSWDDSVESADVVEELFVPVGVGYEADDTEVSSELVPVDPVDLLAEEELAFELVLEVAYTEDVTLSVLYVTVGAVSVDAEVTVIDRDPDEAVPVVQIYTVDVQSVTGEHTADG